MKNRGYHDIKGAGMNKISSVLGLMAMSCEALAVVKFANQAQINDPITIHNQIKNGTGIRKPLDVRND